MALFHYRAADPSGKVIEGSIEAEAEHTAVTHLHGMGLIPLRLTLPGEARRKSGDRLGPLFGRSITQQGLLHFTRELSTLLGAGLPLDRSLSALSGLVEGDDLKKTVRLLLESVRAGKSLAGSMGEHPRVFPRLYVSMVQAGETGGILGDVLHHLVEYLERSVALREDLKSALSYPLLLVTVAGVSLTVLFLYVIPKFSLLFEDVQDTLPWMTKALLAFSQALRSYGWAGVLACAFGAVLVYLHLRTTEGRLRWDRCRLELPLLGDLFRKIEVARFSRTLSALLRGGVPLLESLGTVRGVMGNLWLARAIEEVQSKVKQGRGMAGPVTESGIFPALALHMIAVGEETGKLSPMLKAVADHYDQEVRWTTKRITSLLEPLLILGLGLIIGIVVFSMLLAITSLHDLPF